MDTVSYELMKDSVSPDKGQRDKRKILKYVGFGFLAVLLLLSATFIYSETQGNLDTLNGQKNLTQIGEEILPVKFGVFQILAALIFVTIWLVLSSIHKRRESSGPKNPLNSEGKTPHMQFENKICGLVIFFLLICLVYLGIRESIDIFEGQEKFLKTDEKKHPFGDFDFVMIGLIVAIICLTSYDVFLLCSMRGSSETFEGKENLRLSKEKFAMFGVITLFLFLIFFLLILFCEMGGTMEISEGIEYLRQTKNKTTSLMVFASATFGLLAILLLLLCGLIFIVCEMLRFLETLFIKENPCETKHKTPPLMNVKFLVFELLLGILYVSFLSVFVFFEMRNILEILEGKGNIHRTEDKTPPLINKPGVLGHIVMLPFLKICLIFVFWGIGKNLEIFVEKENPHQTEEKPTRFIKFMFVTFGILVFIFIESLLSILMYYEMQGILDILDGIENIVRTDEKTSSLMIFKVVAYGLMAVSFLLNVGLVFVFSMKRLYFMVFQTQGNTRQAEEKTLLMNVQFPTSGHFVILLFFSISLLICELRRFMKMFEVHDYLPEIEEKLFH